MTRHCRFGGSTIARTIACPSWAKLAEGLPPGEESEYAKEGTLLHSCMEELMLNDNLTYDGLLAQGREYKGVQLTEELVAEKLRPAMDALMNLMDSFEIDNYICEPFVSIADDIGGSIDLIGINGKGQVVLVDYKFGHNPVSAYENKQLMFYALCASLDEATSYLFEKVNEIVQVIIQPTQESVASIYHYELEELAKFEQQVANAIKLARAEGDSMAVGDHCRWCPAEIVCPLKTGQALTASRMDPEQTAHLAEMLPLAEQLESWIKKVKTAAHEQLELGVPVEGYKLVAKRASRIWNDPAEVRKKVSHARKIKLEDAYDMKLKSPAQLEKVCKQKGVDFKKYQEYISSVSSGTTLAKESDTRPAVKVTANQLEELRKLT